MDDLYNLLQEIRRFPEIYIGKPSLERLSFFIHGYCFHNSFDENANNCLVGFQQYVADRYEMYTDHHWSSIIQFFNLEKERGAFDEFYELFDEFIELKKQSEQTDSPQKLYRDKK